MVWTNYKILKVPKWDWTTYQSSLLKLNPRTAADIIEYKLQKIEEYKNGNKLIDDLTMLTILFNQNKE